MAHLRRRNKQTRSEEQQNSNQSFFSSKSPVIQKKKDGSFFQAKLTVGEPDDQYEKEADSVANTVVNQQHTGTAPVQKKKISGIQRLSTSKEDESASTDEERMRKDKEVQRKPELQRETKPLEEEDKKMGGGAVQKKPDATGGIASSNVSSRIEQNTGKGQSLPAKTKEQMQSSFGESFDHVNIHTDAESVALNRDLGAQAFTHGRDIYFNSGKYDPSSKEGQKLLAHELTHVVQQTKTPGTESSGDK